MTGREIQAEIAERIQEYRDLMQSLDELQKTLASNRRYLQMTFDKLGEFLDQHEAEADADWWRDGPAEE
jgi:hypothetical protein